MASPCEILVDTDDEALAKQLCRIAHDEAKRIERKFSRYQTSSELSRINRSRGKPIQVDDETAQLLDYAEYCWKLSAGKFDISSGVLRAVWRFDGSGRLPDPAAVSALLAKVGWQKIQWRKPNLTLPIGMELDFGGIGKEYAVDRSALLIRQQSDVSVLINFGGDLFSSGSRRDDQTWLISIDDPRRSDGSRVATLQLRRGGVATSGDAHRYLLKDGVRYGHILDPMTGWPVPNAPRSVTVSAQTCVEAGMLATFAMLQGADAEKFLREHQVVHWCVR